jgi:ABC-type lipoprotein export system ATPase subunit
VTHGEEVARRADRVVHMKDGRIDRDVHQPRAVRTLSPPAAT